MRLINVILPLAAVASLAAASPSWASDPAADGNAGLDALNQGDYGRAVMLFSRALNSGKLSNADKEFAYSQRGSAYLKQGNAHAAVADFQHALKLKPDDQDVQTSLEEAQSQSASASSHVSGGASNPEQAAQAGMDALNAGDFSRAIILFTRALNSGRLSSDDTELALVNRGKAYLQKGDYNSAVTDLNRALRMKSDDQEAMGAFGQALGHMQSRTPVDAIDGTTCTRNFSSIGSVFTGKSYTGYAEYPTLPMLDAFAGVYSAIGRYSPNPGLSWQITSVNLDAGTIEASVTYPGGGRTVTLDARVVAEGGGSKITIKETVPGLMPTIDLKGSLCNTLADAAKG